MEKVKTGDKEAMTLLEHTIRKIYEKHGLEFHSEHLGKEIEITESDHACMLCSQHILMHVATVSKDEETGMKIVDLSTIDEANSPYLIIDRATGEYHPLKYPFSPEAECYVYDSWTESQKDVAYRQFREKAFEELILKQKDFEAFIKKNQQIKMGLFRHRLILGNDITIPFSLLGVKIIGSLAFSIKMFLTCIVFVKQKG
ncbi:MAG: hypothetical protein R3B47_20505 [Bacteroidia bacterium]